MEAADGGRRHYVALLHTRDARGSYTTLAYKFAAQPPFGVLGVSRPLPLQAGPFAFASGLALVGDKVVVTYGVADVESRALACALAPFPGALGWATVWKQCVAFGVG